MINITRLSSLVKDVHGILIPALCGGGKGRGQKDPSTAMFTYYHHAFLIYWHAIKKTVKLYNFEIILIIDTMLSEKNFRHHFDRS